MRRPSTGGARNSLFAADSISPWLNGRTTIILQVDFIRSAYLIYPLLRWGCREHFVSGCWRSSGRDCGRYPRECWLSTLGVLHPGVPVMWRGHIRDLSPTAESCMGGRTPNVNVVTLGTTKVMLWWAVMCCCALCVLRVLCVHCVCRVCCVLCALLVVVCCCVYCV